MTIEELKLKWEQNLATIEKRMPSASRFPNWDIENALAGQILEFLNDIKLLAAPAVSKSVCTFPVPCNHDWDSEFCKTRCSFRKEQTVC